MRGSGFRSPTCEYTSPGETGLDHRRGEWALLAPPLRSFDGGGLGEQWTPGSRARKSFRTRSGSSLPPPSPQLLPNFHYCLGCFFKGRINIFHKGHLQLTGPLRSSPGSLCEL